MWFFCFSDNAGEPPEIWGSTNELWGFVYAENIGMEPPRMGIWMIHGENYGDYHFGGRSLIGSQHVYSMSRKRGLLWRFGVGMARHLASYGQMLRWTRSHGVDIGMKAVEREREEWFDEKCTMKCDECIWMYHAFTNRTRAGSVPYIQRKQYIHGWLMMVGLMDSPMNGWIGWLMMVGWTRWCTFCGAAIWPGFRSTTSRSTSKNRVPNR